MRPRYLLVLTFTLSIASAPVALHADEFDFDASLGYESSSFSSSTSLSLGPVLPVEPVSFETDIDTDDLRIDANWYFAGVTSNEGPRSRAVFLSRASSVGFSYTRTNGDFTARVDSSDPAIPSTVQTSDQTGDLFGFDLRYVWPGSGWYVLAGFAFGELAFDDAGLSADLDATSFVVGTGKYVGQRTAIDLIVIYNEVEASLGGGLTDSSDGWDLGLSFTHIGDLGATWQYGADIDLATDDVGGSDFAYDLRGSLYPSRNVAFGLGINGGLGADDVEETRFEVFGSWFPNESVGLEASYGWTTFDEPSGTNTDQDSFSISGVVRF